MDPPATTVKQGPVDEPGLGLGGSWPVVVAQAQQPPGSASALTGPVRSVHSCFTHCSIQAEHLAPSRLHAPQHSSELFVRKLRYPATVSLPVLFQIHPLVGSQLVALR